MQQIAQKPIEFNIRVIHLPGFLLVLIQLQIFSKLIKWNVIKIHISVPFLLSPNQDPRSKYSQLGSALLWEPPPILYKDKVIPRFEDNLEMGIQNGISCAENVHFTFTLPKTLAYSEQIWDVHWAFSGRSGKGEAAASKPGILLSSAPTSPGERCDPCLLPTTFPLIFFNWPVTIFKDRSQL